MPKGDNPRIGARHPRWKGDDAGAAAGRRRARKRYQIGLCERCGAVATDRHHVDGNTLNNDRGNIAILCRRCHMLVDGRIEKFVAAKGSRAPGNSKCKDRPIRPCTVCGRHWKYLRKGRCTACSDYFRKHGIERSALAVERWHRAHGTTWDQHNNQKEG